MPINSVQEVLTEGARELLPADFENYQQEFCNACFSLSYSVIKRLGLFEQKGDSETFNSIKEKIALSGQAEYIMKQLLQVLLEENVLTHDSGTYTCIDSKETSGPMETMVSLVRSYPGEGASFQWVARAYDGMFDVIKGNCYPEDVLFPWGSFDLVEDVYTTSGVYQFYSRLAGKAVAALGEHYFPGKKLEFLEVGAGTGSGTGNMLQYNAERFGSYVFTDISRSLLKKSKKRFTGDYFDFKLLDIDKDPLTQSFEPGSFDMVAAVNVLHAVPDVQKALSHIHSLLKKGGCLILAEVSPPKEKLYRYMELTFGLLPSYNAYTDKELRPLAPILRPEEWMAILEKTGFVKTDAYPYGKLDLDDRGGIVIGCKE